MVLDRYLRRSDLCYGTSHIMYCATQYGHIYIVIVLYMFLCGVVRSCVLVGVCGCVVM